MWLSCQQKFEFRENGEIWKHSMECVYGGGETMMINKQELYQSIPDEGKQRTPLPNMPVWHKDYWGMITSEKQQA